MTIKYYLEGNEVTDRPAIIRFCDRQRSEETKYEKLIYLTYNEEKYLKHLRNIRKMKCFPIINRGKLWYDALTEQQAAELKAWYDAWLQVTNTKVIPLAPEWLV